MITGTIFTPWFGTVEQISELWRHTQHLQPDREANRDPRYMGECGSRLVTGAHLMVNLPILVYLTCLCYFLFNPSGYIFVNRSSIVMHELFLICRLDIRHQHDLKMPTP